MEARTNPLAWPAWAWRGLFGLAFVLAAYSLARGLSQLARTALLLNDAGIDDPGFRVVAALNGTTWLITTTIGLLVLLRGRHDPRAVLLALVLLPFAIRSAGFGPPGANPAHLVQYLVFLGNLAAATSYAFFCPLFCMLVSGGAANAGQRRAVKALALTLAILALSHQLIFNPALGPAVAPALRLFIVGTLLATVMCTSLGILLWNYRTSDASSRNRIKIVLLAFVAYLLSWLLADQVGWFARTEEFRWVPLLAAGSTLTGLFGVSLIAFAVLRQKLFDLNFALNRTLVYGAVSFILLATFGLAEWGVEQLHLIPEEWHEGGTVVSAGIALALFLSFHRLRDWIEHHIERLLFSSWHRNEEALRRFIGAADHFGSTPALLKAFAAELSRFAGGAEAALYVRAGDGYELQAGKLAKAGRRCADDDRALALMRAERGPVDIARAHSALPGELALPMLDQGALLGFVLLGPKPDGAPYRPDEIEVLGWAAQQVGFAAQAQHVRLLEGTIADLRAEVAALSKGRRGAATAA